MDHIEKILRDSLQDAEYADGTPCEVIYKEDIPEIMRKVRKEELSNLQLEMLASEELKKHNIEPRFSYRRAFIYGYNFLKGN